MTVIGVAVLGVVVWGVVVLSRANRNQISTPPTVTPSGPSPRDILDRRYASGEIDTADYEERKSKLQ